MYHIYLYYIDSLVLYAVICLLSPSIGSCIFVIT